MSTVHVDNVCHAVELALAKGRGGQAYFVTDGTDTTLKGLPTRLAASRSSRVPNASLAKRMGEPGTCVSAIASGVLVRTARVTSVVASRSHVAALSRPVFESARESLSNWTCRSDRCCRRTCR